MMESKITIGLPVYNGEKTIRESLQSVVSQTFADFVLIISDNNSTDNTQSICEEFVKCDKRIMYFRQNKNMGGLWNLEYLLNSAKTKYFVWLAADDFWASTFLEKNIHILDTKNDVVASIGKTAITGKYYHQFDYDKNDNIIRKFYKKIRLYFLSFDYYGTNESNYEDRVRTCFKSFRFALCIYSIFRTDALKKSTNYVIGPWDWTVILRILEYGNLYVIDEVLSYRALGGTSNTNSINVYLHKDKKFSELLFPKIPFTKWCITVLGKKFFLKNIFFFIRLNYSGLIIIILDLIKYFRSCNSKKPYYFESSDYNAK